MMVRIAVNTQELSDKVGIVSKVIAARVIRPILDYIVFDITENGVYLLASDLETDAKARLNCESEGAGKFAVDGKMLTEVVQTLPTDADTNLEFALTSLTIECGKSRFKLPVIDPSEFPEVSFSVFGAGFEIEGNVLHEMIEKVIFCAVTDEFARNLNGVFWELRNGFMRLVASDSFRLALVEEKLDIQGETSFLLSLKSMKELMSVAASCGEKRLKIEYDGKRVGVVTSDVETLMRVVEAEFPDYKRVLPKAFKTKVIVSTKDLVEALKRMMVIAKHGGEFVKVGVVGDALSLSSESLNYGEAAEELEVTKEGEDITAVFNPKFLVGALKHIESDEVELNFTDSLSPLQINPHGVSNYVCLVIPIRRAV